MATIYVIEARLEFGEWLAEDFEIEKPDAEQTLKKLLEFYPNTYRLREYERKG